MNVHVSVNNGASSLGVATANEFAQGSNGDRGEVIKPGDYSKQIGDG